MRATSNGLNNAAYNNFDNYLSNLTINNCNYGLRLSGDMDGGGLVDQQVVTLNTFAHIYLNIGTGPCLDLTRFADTNFFYDFMCGYGGGPSQPGVVLNSYGPTSEEYVGNNQFFGLQVEDSMSASSVPLQINHSDSNQVFGYHNASHSGDGYAISSVSPGNNIYGYHPIAGPFYNIILLPNNGIIRADDGSNNIKSVLTMVNGNIVLGNGGQYIQLQDRLLSTAGTQSTTYNYIASETGSNNAIAGALSLTQAVGLEVEIVLAHTLQAGANTFAYNGGSALPITKHTNPASNLTVAYAVGGVIKLICDGTHWLDLSQ
jgi:hypothetical protein